MTTRDEAVQPPGTVEGGAMEPVDLLLALLGGFTYLFVGTLVAAVYLRLLVGEGGRDADAVVLVILTWPAWLLVGTIWAFFRPWIWLARRLGLGPARPPHPSEYVPGREPPGLEKGPRRWYWPWGNL